MRNRTQWRVIPVPDVADDYDGHFRAIRLNSLGSLYWFAKHVLGYTRLSTLHKHLCKSLENLHLFLVMEVPMSHFKTRLGIALSIWWALPFNDFDEKHMRDLGYGDAWIRYMRAIHDQNMRTLVCHEIAGQATAIGRDVDAVYEHNDVFRNVFREIIPDKECIWNNATKYQKRLPGGDASTGTFEYRGVGQTLQGIHVKGVIVDDIFGREAQVSVLRGDGKVAQETISWFQQVGTRYDPQVKKDRRQLVIGNPWCHADINAWIRANLPDFDFENHDAEGGCCKLHPAGVPILPSEWTMELLHKEKLRLDASETKGDYEHFYRCKHVLPGERLFDPEWLRKFKFKQSRPELRLDDPRNILLLEHAVYGGTAIEDFQPGGLMLRMIVGPNDAKSVNRKEHIIWVVGYDVESTRIYLLSLHAEDSKYSDLVEEIYKTAKRWRLDNFWMGERAAELLSFYIQQRDRMEPQSSKLTVNTFADDDSPAGVKNKIEALEPLIRGRQVWMHESQKKFETQISMYPGGAIDTLAVLANFSDTIQVVHGADDFLQAQREAFLNRSAGQGGY